MYSAIVCHIEERKGLVLGREAIALTRDLLAFIVCRTTNIITMVTHVARLRRVLRPARNACAEDWKGSAWQVHVAEFQARSACRFFAQDGEE